MIIMYNHIIGNIILFCGGLPFLWKLSRNHLENFSNEWVKSEVRIDSINETCRIKLNLFRFHIHRFSSSTQ